MKRTAVVVAPGRGTYNSQELGYLRRHHGDKQALVDAFDAYRARQGQEPISTLDSLERFSAETHTRGDHASALIFACAYLDFLSIDRDRYDIVAVTGNSMGWYIALACAGALEALDGLRVANTMGTLMQEHMIGGQLVYPFLDENWKPVTRSLYRIFEKMYEIDSRPDHVLKLSIDLGGMIVLAGNDAGLAAFEKEMPKVQDRFPVRLPNHAAFHTDLQKPVAEAGRQMLLQSLFGEPKLPLVNGRGGIWYPKAVELSEIWSYTFDAQVVEHYDFTSAIRVAAYEFMPDVFIVLGPGATLGGAVAQSLVQANWRGMDSKAEFQREQAATPRLLAMGVDDQRPLVAIEAASQVRTS